MLVRVIMGRGKTSKVWKHFEDDVQPDKAKCKLCPQKVSRGSKDPKKQTTYAMKVHLERHHEKEYNELFGKTEEKNETMESDSDDESVKVQISKLRTQADRKKLLKSTIPGWLEAKNKLPFDSLRAKQLHKLIFEMTILDFQPYTIVNDAGFIRLMNYLEPRYEIPSDK